MGEGRTSIWRAVLKVYEPIQRAAWAVHKPIQGAAWAVRAPIWRAVLDGARIDPARPTAGPARRWPC